MSNLDLRFSCLCDCSILDKFLEACKYAFRVLATLSDKIEFFDSKELIVVLAVCI